jgi:hypothetical protein
MMWRVAKRWLCESADVTVGGVVTVYNVQHFGVGGVEWMVTVFWKMVFCECVSEETKDDHEK